MSIRRALALFVVLSGCVAADDQGTCATEDVTYHVEVRLGPRTLARFEGLGPSDRKLASGPEGGLEASDYAHTGVDGEPDVPPGREGLPTAAKLVVSVYEDTSIVSCEGDLVTSRVPGNTLAVVSRGVAPALSLDIPLTRYRELGTPLTMVGVRIDRDGTRACDDDDPSGVIRFDPDQPKELVIELDSKGCPARL